MLGTTNRLFGNQEFSVFSRTQGSDLRTFIEKRNLGAHDLNFRGGAPTKDMTTLRRSTRKLVGVKRTRGAAFGLAMLVIAAASAAGVAPLVISNPMNLIVADCGLRFRARHAAATKKMVGGRSEHSQRATRWQILDSVS